MTKEQQRVLKQACEALGIDPKAIMDAKVYPDRVVIIDPIGRKLTCPRLNLPAAKPKPRAKRPATS